MMSNDPEEGGLLMVHRSSAPQGTNSLPLRARRSRAAGHEEGNRGWCGRGETDRTRHPQWRYTAANASIELGNRRRGAVYVDGAALHVPRLSSTWSLPLQTVLDTGEDYDSCRAGDLRLTHPVDVDLPRTAHKRGRQTDPVLS